MDYKKTYDAVKAVLHKHDPIGLIAGGAPDDEYDSQVGAIVRLLSNNIRDDELVKSIRDVFVDSFDEKLAGDESVYRVIVEDIFR